MKKELMEVLEGVEHNGDVHGIEGLSPTQAYTAIIDLMMEVVGEDKPCKYYSGCADDCDCGAYNTAKAEIRAKLKG